MGTGYELAKCLTGTLWEPDFVEVCNLVLIDLNEFGPECAGLRGEIESFLGVQ